MLWVVANFKSNYTDLVERWRRPGSFSRSHPAGHDQSDSPGPGPPRRLATRQLQLRSLSESSVELGRCDHEVEVDEAWRAAPPGCLGALAKVASPTPG